MSIQSLFITQLLRDSFTQESGWAELNTDLEQACLQVAEDDEAGQKWCDENGYDGYTSYASLNDLADRANAFSDLKEMLDAKANDFSTASYMDIGCAKWEMDSYWINILNPLAAHSGHIHPHSVISGTYYVKTPEGAGALKLEDPRLAMMMNAPGPNKDAPRSAQRFVYEKPEPGTVMMWESWLRHEVTANMGEDLRISISFNYSLI
ncbi:TIGR02466 family protein [Hirschia maritima]|uniref:TIGR02466 family protein n=1 Tax=Hirschia maritima TaxID=1121961 RepID=UPI0003800854|nr:TIGR02466 family protein [Hirschia maritima]